MIDKKANEVAEVFLLGKDKCKFEQMPIRCTKCGKNLGVYYCENRLYAVQCTTCKSVTLVYAARKLDAARKVGAYERK